MTSRYTLPVLLVMMLVMTAGCNPFHNQKHLGERNRTVPSRNSAEDTTASHQQVQENEYDANRSQRRMRRRKRHRHGHLEHGRNRKTRDKLSSDTDEPDTIDRPDESKPEELEESSGDTVLDRIEAGRSLYQQYCSGCHGANREGNPPAIPELQDVDDRLSDEKLLAVINQGPGRMPSFTYLSEAEKRSLLQYLSD